MALSKKKGKPRVKRRPEEMEALFKEARARIESGSMTFTGVHRALGITYHVVYQRAVTEQWAVPTWVERLEYQVLRNPLPNNAGYLFPDEDTPLNQAVKLILESTGISPLIMVSPKEFDMRTPLRMGGQKARQKALAKSVNPEAQGSMDHDILMGSESDASIIADSSGKGYVTRSKSSPYKLITEEKQNSLLERLDKISEGWISRMEAAGLPLPKTPGEAIRAMEFRMKLLGLSTEPGGSTHQINIQILNGGKSPVVEKQVNGSEVD